MRDGLSIDDGSLSLLTSRSSFVMPYAGLSLMPEEEFLEAALPLFEAGLVDAVEWSFDTGWHDPRNEWLATLVDEYSKAGRLTGHGVHFSLLSAEWTPRQQGWLDRFREEIHRYQYLHHTEHFGFMTGGDFHQGAPLPVPLTEATLKLGQMRFAQLAEISPCPMGLENLALALKVEDALQHHEFLEKIVAPSNGFLLLDLHNIYCQLCNFNLSPSDLFDNYPFHLVREIHLSGGSWQAAGASGRTLRRDTHDDDVPPAVFALLEFVLPRCPNLEVVFLERLGHTLRPEFHQGFRRDFQTLRSIVGHGSGLPRSGSGRFPGGNDWPVSCLQKPGGVAGKNRRFHHSGRPQNMAAILRSGYAGNGVRLGATMGIIRSGAWNWPAHRVGTNRQSGNSPLTHPRLRPPSRCPDYPYGFPNFMAYTLDQAYSRLSEAQTRGRLAHAYLLVGPAGAGKEALACRLIGLTHGRPVPSSLDEAVGDGVTVLRPASKSRRIKVNDVHELESTLRLTVGRQPLKIGVIVEADRLMVQAQNTFLKTLEEPPKNTLLLLLSEVPEQLLPTILSRCIEVPLVGPVRLAPEPGSAEAELLDLLAGYGTLAERGVRPSLLMARGFAEILAKRKDAIAARHKAVFAEEVAAVKKTTEGGNWLDDREEEMEAMAEADYLAERSRLIATLLSWFGDAVRLQAGVRHLDIPEREKPLAMLAANAQTRELLDRQTSMERLRDLFQTNTSEALAIEVCFLRAFG